MAPSLTVSATAPSLFHLHLHAPGHLHLFHTQVSWTAAPQVMALSTDAFGWKLCFYSAAALGVPWCALWIALASSDPPGGPVNNSTADADDASSSGDGDGDSGAVRLLDPAAEHDAGDAGGGGGCAAAGGGRRAAQGRRAGGGGAGDGDGGRGAGGSTAPWKLAFTSPAMVSGFVSNFGLSWGFYVLLTFLPQHASWAAT